MHQTIGLILVLLCASAVVVFMVRSLMPATRSDHDGPFAGFGSTGTVSGFGGGLVAAVAAATTLHGTGAGAAGAAAVGAALGLAYSVLTALGLTVGIRIVAALVGTTGFVALVTFLLAGSGCAVVPLWQRLLILGLIVFWGVAGAVGSAMIARPRIPSTLAMFGALKIAVFLSAPLGMSLLTLPDHAWPVAVVAAAFMGVLSTIAPQFLIGLAVAVIGVTSLGVGVVVGDTCSAGPNATDLAALAGFSAAYLVSRFAGARLLRR